jgi:hypothetical protein
LILFCFTAVLAAALAFAAIVAGASFALVRHRTPDAPGAREQQANPNPTGPKEENHATFSGLVTDSYCGARHRRYRNLSPTQCAAACMRDGATLVLVNGDHLYKLTGSEEALTKLLGTRANVTGTLQGDTILVDSAAPLF